MNSLSTNMSAVMLFKLISDTVSAEKSVEDILRSLLKILIPLNNKLLLLFH